MASTLTDTDYQSSRRSDDQQRKMWPLALLALPAIAFAFWLANEAKDTTNRTNTTAPNTTTEGAANTL